MTKSIILSTDPNKVKVKGRIKVKCIVTDQGKFRGQTRTGYATIKPGASINQLFRNAILDCIYQHLRTGGKSSPSVQVLSYKMEYLGVNQNLLKVKRVTRRDRSGKKRRYTYFYDAKTNKILTYGKERSVRNLQKNV